MKMLDSVVFLGVALLAGCPHDPAGSTDAGQDAGPAAPRCDTNNGGCDANAKCVQGADARQCICLPWYDGDGLTCTKSGLQVGSPWPVMGGNVRHTGQSPYRGPQTSRLYWSIQMEGGSACSPVIDANGTIYVGAFHALHAYSPSKAEVWMYDYPDSGVSYWSTPALGANGLLYSQASSRALYVIDPVRNPIKRVVWSYSTGDVDGTPPTIGADGTVYASTINADRTGSLYAFSTTRTTPAWNFSSSHALATPAIGSDGTVFVASARELHAINPADGKQKWSIPIAGGVDFALPVIGPDGTVFVGSQSGYLYAIDPATQAVKSKQVATRIDSLALAADGTLYVGDLHGLLAIDPATVWASGSPKWTMATREPVSHIVIGADGTVYASTDQLYAVNPDGSVKWSTSTLTSTLTSSAIAADGTLYIQDTNGILFAFQDQP